MPSKASQKISERPLQTLQKYRSAIDTFMNAIFKKDLDSWFNQHSEFQN